jgi:hypothetical protein
MNQSVLFPGFDPQLRHIQLLVLSSLKNQNGFATIFSLLISLLLCSFCATFMIVATVLSVQHKANHATEEAALITASTLDCGRALEIADANDAEILICNINVNHVYNEPLQNTRIVPISSIRLLIFVK